MSPASAMNDSSSGPTLEERLAASPVVEVRGLVDASGAGGGSVGGADWDLIFHFCAWRVGESPVRADRPMRCYYGVAQSSLSRWMADIQPYRVWRVRAAVLAEPLNGQIHGRIVEIVGPALNDAELNAEAEGRLTYERRYNWFEGEVQWCGEPVVLRIDGSADGTAPSRAGMATALALLADQAAWRDRVNAFAVERLLPLHNETWREDDDAELDGEAFVACMRLSSISIDAEGGFDFWHADGDLFYGHAIQISGSVAEGPTDADIPG